MKTVNFSLFGNGYEDGLLPNLAAVTANLPGWRMRVFHDGCLTGREPQGMDSIHVPLDVGGGMFWRFMGMIASSCAIFRDLDSLVNERDAALVKTWELSGKALHVIHDHRHHCNPQAWIPGGMWGVRPDLLPFDLAKLISWWLKHKGPFGYGSDQWFLNRYVWPYALRDGLLHLHPDDAITGDKWPGGLSPVASGFVGERLYGPNTGKE